MRACWLKWVGRDWSISADYIWLNYSGANKVAGRRPKPVRIREADTRTPRCPLQLSYAVLTNRVFC